MPFWFPSARVPDTSVPRKLPDATSPDAPRKRPALLKRLTTNPCTVIAPPRPGPLVGEPVPSSSTRSTALVPDARVLGREPGWELPSIVAPEIVGSSETGLIDHQLCGQSGSMSAM